MFEAEIDWQNKNIQPQLKFRRSNEKNNVNNGVLIKKIVATKMQNTVKFLSVKLGTH